MKELSRREKEAGIFPDPDVDAYMKVMSEADCLSSHVFVDKLEVHCAISCA